jgi:hypothetical protein
VLLGVSKQSIIILAAVVWPIIVITLVLSRVITVSFHLSKQSDKERERSDAIDFRKNREYAKFALMLQIFGQIQRLFISGRAEDILVPPSGALKML